MIPNYYIFGKKIKAKIIGIFVIVILTTVSYLPLFEADFIEFDDRLYVTKNDWVRAGITRDGIVWAFTHYHSANWHPLTWLSHMLDCEIYGMNAKGHHVSNLVLHIINCILVFLFFSQVTGAFNRCLVLALLFALHPLHVESVAWIAERKDMLSTFFGLLCLISYYRYTQTFQKRHYYYCFTWLCLSLMSKPMLVTMPVLLIILDIWPICRKDDQRFRDKLFFFTPVAGVALITFLAQYQDKAVNPLSSLSLMPRLLNAFNSICTYLIKTVWPSNFSVLYPHPGYDVHIWPAMLCLFILIGLIITASYTLKQMPFFLTGLLWFLIALMPVIGIIQVGSQAMADRYTYIPHIGLFWAFIWLVSYISNTKNRTYVVNVIFIVFLIIFASKTYEQAKVWQKPETLFLQAVENTKNNYLIYNNLGVLAYESLSHERALTYFDKSLAIRPHFFDCLLNKAKCLVSMKRFDEGMNVYQAILSVDTKNIDAYLGLAEIYRIQKKYQLALEQCQKALKHKTLLEKVYSKIAFIFDQMGLYKNSAYYYNHLLKIKPLSPVYHYEYARTLVRLELFQKAIIHYKRAIALNPNFAEAYNNLGAVYSHMNLKEKAYENIAFAYQLSPENEMYRKNYKTIKEKLSSER